MFSREDLRIYGSLCFPPRFPCPSPSFPHFQTSFYKMLVHLKARPCCQKLHLFMLLRTLHFWVLLDCLVTAFQTGLFPMPAPCYFLDDLIQNDCYKYKQFSENQMGFIIGHRHIPVSQSASKTTNMWLMDCGASSYHTIVIKWCCSSHLESVCLYGIRQSHMLHSTQANQPCLHNLVWRELT